MYCSVCASPVTSGLKFCNRCGANLKNGQADNGGDSANALITAVVLIALSGLGLMFGGAIALQGAGMNNDIVALFMFFTFVIVGVTEVFLLRHLSRRHGAIEQSRRVEIPPPLFQPAPSALVRELHAVRDTAEPISSVTENTTRTLEHALRDIRDRN